MNQCSSWCVTLLLVAGMLLFVAPANAVNWAILQGTEPAHSDGRPKLWGFIQTEYQHTEGSTIAAGAWAGQPVAGNMIGPDFESSSTFNIKRMRLGVRGTLPGFKDFNYLISMEGGNNGITKYGNGVELVDASISATVQPWLLFRAGQFKYPGSEEGMRPATMQPYINNSVVVGQLLNETFFDGDGSGTDGNLPNGPRGCFHDIGLQVFGILPFGSQWEHTYAAMAGNGNGLTRSDNNEYLDYYHFNPNVRLMVDYAWRAAEAPGMPESSAANRNLDNLDDKIMAQLQLVFP